MFTPTFLNNLNFKKSTYLIMMNDVKRNQFYNNILSEITDKTCLEIGFGAGLLSLIALKHQPKHIVAVERNLTSFELGKYLIKKSGLENKITLIHEQIDASFINPSEFDLVYHEILGSNLWDENVFFQLGTAVPMIPSEYTCELYACEISADEFLKLDKDPRSHTAAAKTDSKFVSWYTNIKDSTWPNVEQLSDFDLLPEIIKIECVECFGFDRENFIENAVPITQFEPGVDVDVDYVNEIQQLVDAYHSRSNAILNIDLPQHRYPPLLNRSKKVSSMTVNQHSKTIAITDHNNVTTVTEIDFAKPYIDLVVDRNALPEMSFIQPIFSLKHHQSTLILSDGHWGYPPNSVIVKQNANNIMVRQHFNTNGIEYSSS
jgi:hypothetical protein